MDPYIGKMLDNRYEILELIGRGGMANVYKAKCHRLDRLVAVKILHSDLAQNADFRRRFMDESRAVAQLSHPNIVSVYDVSCSDDVDYIVMELIDGVTLKQYMERRGQMDWREALHFITQIMRGLSHAHSRGVIHRDIKPQNIMVLRDGSVRVADFGIACLADQGQTLTQETLGSVHYISPEQARGDRVDARSDIYSAGVVLYEMLTGKLPFQGDSAVSVAIQHLSAVPKAPRELNPDIPEALELICMKAMCPDISKRYQTADAMLDDLEKFRKDPAVDMDYIREDLKAAVVCQEPTQPLPTDRVAAVSRANSAVAQEEEDKKHSRKVVGLVIGGFALALVLIFVVFKLVAGGFDAGSGTASHKVPDLRGLTLEEAQELPEVKGVFTVVEKGTKTSTEYKPGQIVEQDPAPGRTRKTELIISVYICAEEEENLMPDVVGKEFQIAKTELSNLHLNLNIMRKETYSPDVPEGQVMQSSPAAGEPLNKGDTVVLTVSKGPEIKPLTVPNFVTMHIDDAAQQAEALGLTVGEHQYEFSDKPEGTVIGQSIQQGTEVQSGTEIVFTVSKGASSAERVVVFDIPEQYRSDSNMKIEVMQDGSIIHSTYVDGGTASFTYTFHGSAGSTSTIKLYINGTEAVAQEITF